jgi:hypothetical protein
MCGCQHRGLSLNTNHISSENVRSPQQRFITRRRLFVLPMVGLAFAAFMISPFSARILATPEPKSPADFLFIADGDAGQCYRMAVDRWKAGQVTGILLWTPERQRVVLLGAELPLEQRARNKLLKDGVASESIQLIPGVSKSHWDTARLLNEWLKEHRDKRVRLLCNLFSGQRWHFILDQTLDISVRSLVTVEGAADPRYDGSNWWRQRTGIKSYFSSLFELAYARCRGEDEMPDVDWSPERFESSLLEPRHR